MIQSNNYATHHSLRFPRVQRVRYDKSYMDVQTNEGLWEYIQQSKGAIFGVQLPFLMCKFCQLKHIPTEVAHMLGGLRD